MRVAVPIIVVADGIEIPEAAIDRQITAPIIWIAFEGDVFTGSDRADRVRPAAEQRLETGVLEGRQD